MVNILTFLVIARSIQVTYIRRPDVQIALREWNFDIFITEQFEYLNSDF
tara:strand:+ start:1043 stop:1189 length:147 start_codon:yes stop_codon:yes gene_type:complete